LFWKSDWGEPPLSLRFITQHFLFSYAQKAVSKSHQTPPPIGEALHSGPCCDVSQWWPSHPTRTTSYCFSTDTRTSCPRNDINLDMLIWLSESNLSGLFSEVSLIRDNQGREFKGNSLIIKGLDNQVMKKLDYQVLIIKVFTTSLPSFPILPTIHRTKHLTE
jgi:hypothetical protein